jgi:hypothetical protein
VAAKGFSAVRWLGIPPENGEAASIDFRFLFGTLLQHWKLVSLVPLLALMICAVAWPLAFTTTAFGEIDIRRRCDRQPA